MSIYTLLFTIIAVSLMFFLLIDILMDDKITNDLIYFVLLFGIFSGVLIVFYYYFQDNVISLVSSFFLMINNFLLIREIKRIYERYLLISIPFFIMSVYYFSYILVSLF